MERGKPGIRQWFGLGEKPIAGGMRFGLMAILNLTPDSFYDGGSHVEPEAALRAAKNLLENGADILDLGGESSRPGSLPVKPGVEVARLAPVLDELARILPPERISVDTWHVETASYALENGAGIVNDVSACLWEPGLLEIIGAAKPGYVLTHNNGLPGAREKSGHHGDLTAQMLRFFELNLIRLAKSGLPENHVALDPGIGFGKTAREDLEILRSLDKFLIFGRPLLLGLSMKSFFGKLFGLPLEKRGAITATASALAWKKGVFWHRVHDPLAVGASLKFAASMERPPE